MAGANVHEPCHFSSFCVFALIFLLFSPSHRWMMAADYFMCARAHGIAVAPELQALGDATIRHLVWRFRKFYGDRKMLRTMVGCDKHKLR